MSTKNKERTPLTKIEEKLIKIIVKEHLFDELESFLNDYTETMEIGNSVTDFLRSIFPNIQDKTCLEILNYCVESYTKIENNDFSNTMERMADVQFTIIATEQEIVYTSYRIDVDTLPSLAKKMKKTIENNFWEFDPDRNIDDYGDNEILSQQIEDPEIGGNIAPEKL